MACFEMAYRELAYFEMACYKRACIERTWHVIKRACCEMTCCKMACCRRVVNTEIKPEVRLWEKRESRRECVRQQRSKNVDGKCSRYSYIYYYLHIQCLFVIIDNEFS